MPVRCKLILGDSMIFFSCVRLLLLISILHVSKNFFSPGYSGERVAMKIE